ncbi:MAG: hypothetical protein IT285_12500 [Bdellovibrionales bacterium]|nr:hypothetical protein [Bdellovibrionales bacterium]
MKASIALFSFFSDRRSSGLRAAAASLAILSLTAAGCGTPDDMEGVERINFRLTVTENGELLPGSQQAVVHAQAYDNYTGNFVAVDPTNVTLVLGKALIVKPLDETYRDLDPETFELSIVVGENGAAQCGLTDYAESGDGTTLTVQYACDLADGTVASVGGVINRMRRAFEPSRRIGEDRSERLAVLTDSDHGRHLPAQGDRLSGGNSGAAAI